MCDFFDHHDFLVTPVGQVAPFNAGITYPRHVDGQPMRNYLEWMRLPSMISVTGCPAISVPAAFTPSGLPSDYRLSAHPDRRNSSSSWRTPLNTRKGQGPSTLPK